MPTGQFYPPSTHELSWMKSFIEDFIDMLDPRSHDPKVREDRSILMCALTKIRVLQSGRLSEAAVWTVMMWLIPWRQPT